LCKKLPREKEEVGGGRWLAQVPKAAVFQRPISKGGKAPYLRESRRNLEKHGYCNHTMFQGSDHTLGKKHSFIKEKADRGTMKSDTA